MIACSSASVISPRMRLPRAAQRAGTSIVSKMASAGSVFWLLEDQVLGLILIAREQALVEAVLQVQRRLIAEQDGEELELGHVSAEHHQADGERAREDQADRPPEKRPECGRYQEGDLGDAHALAVEPGLDRVGNNELERSGTNRSPGGSSSSLR